jgi:hypothetical protein
MGKASRLKRERKRARTADETLADRVRHSALGRETMLVKDPPGFEKVSDMLAKLARPLIEQSKTKEEYKEVLHLAAIAWNAALLPEEERAGMLHEKKTAAGLGPTGIRLMEKLIERKLALFPNERRPVLDIEVADLGGRFHLSVISEIPASDPRARKVLEAKGLLPKAG